MTCHSGTNLQHSTNITTLNQPCAMSHNYRHDIILDGKQHRPIGTQERQQPKSPLTLSVSTMQIMSPAANASPSLTFHSAIVPISIVYKKTPVQRETLLIMRVLPANRHIPTTPTSITKYSLKGYIEREHISGYIKRGARIINISSTGLSHPLIHKYL